jgi:hypothetical protein
VQRRDEHRESGERSGGGAGNKPAGGQVVTPSEHGRSGVEGAGMSIADAFAAIAARMPIAATGTTIHDAELLALCDEFFAVDALLRRWDRGEHRRYRCLCWCGL